MTENEPEENTATLPQEIAEIYGRHVSMLHRVCYSYMKNAADTEDIVSDVFIKLIRHGAGFQSDEHEKAWLLRIAINLCKDNLKHWRRNVVNIDDYDLTENTDPFYEDETFKTIMELPERYKAVVYLHYYEGYSSAEISEILKRPKPTVLYHLHIARKLLKEGLNHEK